MNQPVTACCCGASPVRKVVMALAVVVGNTEVSSATWCAARADPAPWRASQRLPRPSSTNSNTWRASAMAEAGRACNSGAGAEPPRALIRLAVRLTMPWPA
jgi:hypothetical protein